uniref:hypothetical protein n=1 Tax=Algoriphagus sp. TaxID=1872435 RepID=UPI004048403B
MIKKLIFNPFFIFWVYYFIGPFLTIPQILRIVNNESIFNENELFFKFAHHFLAYSSIFPFIFYICMILKLDNFNRGPVKLLGGLRGIVVAPVIIFIIFLFYFLYSNILLVVGADYPRAVAYIIFLESNSVITILIILLINIYLFLDKKYMGVLGFFVIIFDSLMSRRSLMIFFFYPLLQKISFKHIVYVFLFFSLFSIFRHRQNIEFQFTSLYAPFFSESYMIFLSTVQFKGCPVQITSIPDYFSFERTFESCRTLNSGAGGFSSRFHYNIFFGTFSVFCFSLISIFCLFFLKKYINKRLFPLLGSILFVTLFIIFRDSLWNAQLFFLKYFFVLIAASFLFDSLNKLSYYFRTKKIY